MNTELGNKRALVTGVTSGIGLATAEALVKKGMRVIGVARNRGLLAELGARLGSRFHPIVADLASVADRQRVAEYVQAMEEPLDVLINNAAECAYVSPLDAQPEQLRELFEVNVVAPLELARVAAQHMRPGAQILQLSSVTARFVANSRFAPYATTKLAVERLVDALRWDLHPKGIRVSTLVPGLVDTPIYDKIDGFERAKEKLREQLPQWLTPEDIADTIVWVLSRPPHLVVSEMTIMPRAQGR